ncbi:MAG: hypothetical protein QG656_1759, partial [Candidatus Hydrogenedentes bacterium]|nr:hypothetical protein [Candidatus Hydrogenedentota bacterium]
MAVQPRRTRTARSLVPFFTLGLVALCLAGCPFGPPVVTGSVTVTLLPDTISALGAMWRVDGGGWTPSGAAVNDLVAGAHTVTFRDIVGWQTPEAQTFTVASAEPVALDATYTAIAHTLTIAVEGQGATVPAAGSASYAYGANVSILATPSAGWAFTEWRGDLTGAANPASLTMDADKTVTAVFTQLSYILTIAVAGGGQTVPAAGVYTYPSGATVTITAEPSNGWAFSRWEGALTGNANPGSCTMDSPKTVTA